MADIRGVGKKITYSEDNPISNEIDALRKSRDNVKRPPKDDEERERLARWLAHRGRDELEVTVGTACYAMAHFEMDCEWRYFLAEHAGTEAGHGWGYIRQASAVFPGRDYAKPDPEFEKQYALTPRTEHHAIMKRDFLSYIFSGNLWPYGHVTAASIQSIQITTPKLLEFEERVVHLEERTHHDAILQKIHDYVWEQIEVWGEAPIRRRIGEIERIALNSRPRTIFDPPRREFLRKYYNVPLDNVRRFPAWREYLYLSVLGFPPEPVYIENWPAEIPQPKGGE